MDDGDAAYSVGTVENRMIPEPRVEGRPGPRSVEINRSRSRVTVRDGQGILDLSSY